MIPVQYLGRLKAAFPRLFAPASEAEQELGETLRQLKIIRKQLGQSLPEVFERESRICLKSMTRTLERLNRRTLSFKTTETWRSVYEEVLASCRSKRYLSVALIDCEGYWRDQPGKCSLQFNYRLVTAGYFVHRLFIIEDFFWPPLARLPETDLLRWINEQFGQGIEISLVRVSELQLEPDLISDFGIYGDEAVGYQQTTEDGRTASYQLHFDPAHVVAAEQRWNKLQLYAIRLETIVDQDATRR